MIQKIEFLDILVQADFARENKPAAVVHLTDLDRGDHVSDRRPSELLGRLFQPRHKIEDAVEIRFSVEESKVYIASLPLISLSFLRFLYFYIPLWRYRP